MTPTLDWELWFKILSNRRFWSAYQPTDARNQEPSLPTNTRQLLTLLPGRLSALVNKHGEIDQVHALGGLL